MPLSPRTLEKNPEIVQARLALEHAAGRRLVFRSTALPDVKIQGVAGLQGGDRADEPALRPFAFARGFFTQPFFDAAVPASLRRGDIEILLAQQRLNVAVVGQLHATRIAFYTALYNHSLRDLGEAQRQRLTAKRQHADRALSGGAIESRGADQRSASRARSSSRASRKCNAAMKARCSPWRPVMGNDPSQRPASLGPTANCSSPPVNYDLQSETAAALSQRRRSPARPPPGARRAPKISASSRPQYYPALDATVSGTGIPTTVRTDQQRLRAQLRQHPFLRNDGGRRLHLARHGQRPSRRRR